MAKLWRYPFGTIQRNAREDGRLSFLELIVNRRQGTAASFLTDDLFLDARKGHEILGLKDNVLVGIPTLSRPPIWLVQKASYSNAGTTPVIITFAQAPAQNDLIVICVNVMDDTNVITPPAGFTLESSGTNPTTFSIWSVYSKVAGASEGTTYSFTTSLTGNQCSGAGEVFRGANTATPFEAKTNQGNTVASTNMSTGAISYSANRMVVMFAGQFGAAATGTGSARWAADGNLIEDVDNNVSSSMIHAASAFDTTARSGVTRTATSLISSAGFAWIGAIQPSSADTTPPSLEAYFLGA